MASTGFFHRHEALFCVALAVFFAIILAISIQMGFGKMKAPGPGFFPAFISIFGIAFSISEAARHLSSSRRSPRIFSDGQRKKFLALVATFCGWLILMPWLGFVIVTFLAAFSFAKIMGLEGWVRPLVLAVSASIFIYLLFDVWFYADLPRGVWH